MNINVTQFPVLVVAGPRTGSTELTTQIALKYNLDSLMEPRFFPGLSEKLDQYAVNGNQDFILKIMPDELDAYPSILEISKRSFNIKLTRLNQVDQMASWYIAKSKLSTADKSINRVVDKLSNHIFQQKTATLDSYTVPINPNDVLKAIG